mmetsp:Transcript_124211/g.362550  ORF Transcript_124211/g.362550 Transcript_124211/m.362550 type:complete len:267 (+) Transcript_124211:10-810(+)
MLCHFVHTESDDQVGHLYIRTEQKRGLSKLQLTDRHPLSHLLVRDFLAPRLMLLHYPLQLLHEPVLHAASVPEVAAPAAVLPRDLLQLRVVLQEEAQPLVGHVHVEVGALLPLLLGGGPTAGEGVLLDLAGDLLRTVREEDCGGGVRSRHLPKSPLQRREELGMQQCGLALEWMRFGHELVGNFARQPEVRVLVNRARNQAAHVVLSVKWDLEGCGERWCCLYRAERRLADVVISLEAKASAGCVVGDAFPNPNDVRVHVANVFEV